jgi:hypothetical protein
MSDEQRVRTTAGWIGVEISRSRVRTPGKAGFGMYRVRRMPRSTDLPEDLDEMWTGYAYTLTEIESAAQSAIESGTHAGPGLFAPAPYGDRRQALGIPVRWTSAYRGRRDLGVVVPALPPEERGVAECGCPNNLLGKTPVLHRCSRCGFEGGYESVHERCSGCAYPVAVRPEHAAELDALVVLLGAGLVEMRHVEGCACGVPAKFTAACVRETMPDRMLQRAQNAAFQAEHLKARAHGLRARYAAKRARAQTTQPVATQDGSTAI